MKIKLALLATLPLLTLAACSDSGSQKPNAQIHGDTGITVQSRNTTHISPERYN